MRHEQFYQSCASAITGLTNSPMPSILIAHFVARTQISGRLARETYAGGRAGGDHVAGLQREHARKICDDLRDVEDQIAGVRILQGLAADRKRNRQSLCGSAISSAVTIAGPMGQKVSKVLPIIHCAGRHLEIARADVVDDGVAEDVIAPMRLGNVAAALADRPRRTRPRSPAGLNSCGSTIGWPGPITEVGYLEKTVGVSRDRQIRFRGVVAVVQADADDLRRARNGRKQAGCSCQSEPLARRAGCSSTAIPGRAPPARRRSRRAVGKPAPLIPIISSPEITPGSPYPRRSMFTNRNVVPPDSDSSEYQRPGRLLSWEDDEFECDASLPFRGACSKRSNPLSGKSIENEFVVDGPHHAGAVTGVGVSLRLSICIAVRRTAD